MSDHADTNLPDIAEMHTALFAQLVMQNANMALMLLGKAPHPQTGKTMRDLEGAQYFIGQLDMLEAKTKGNLSREEQALLKQNLMTLRLAFVETVGQPEEKPAVTEPAEPVVAEPAKVAPANAEENPAPPAADAETPDAAGAAKRFTKKY